jgi:hypothetical protein
MTHYPEPWITKNNSLNQTVAMSVMIVAGIVMTWGFGHLNGDWSTERISGFLLGMLLTAIGIAGVIAGGETIITVDSKSQTIKTTSRSMLGLRTDIIKFRDIEKFTIGSLGDRDGGSIRYYVIAKLKSGKEKSLFLGFFEGSLDRSSMETRRDRLNACLAASNS